MVKCPDAQVDETQKRINQEWRRERDFQAKKIVEQLIQLTHKRDLVWQKRTYPEGYITKWKNIEVALSAEFSHQDFPGCERLFSLHLDFSPSQSPFFTGITGQLAPEYKYPYKGLGVVRQREIVRIVAKEPFSSLKKLYGLIEPDCENDWWLQQYSVQAEEILKMFGVNFKDSSSAKKTQKAIIGAVTKKTKEMQWTGKEDCYQAQYNGVEIAIVFLEIFNLVSLIVKAPGEEFPIRIEGEIKKGYGYCFKEGFFAIVPIEFDAHRRVFPDTKVGFYNDLKALYDRVQRKTQKGQISKTIAGVIESAAELKKKFVV